MWLELFVLVAIATLVLLGGVCWRVARRPNYLDLLGAQFLCSVVFFILTVSIIDMLWAQYRPAGPLVPDRAADAEIKAILFLGGIMMTAIISAAGLTLLAVLVLSGHGVSRPELFLFCWLVFSHCTFLLLK